MSTEKVARIQLRVSEEIRKSMKECADEEGLSLSGYLRKLHLDAQRERRERIFKWTGLGSI